MTKPHLSFEEAVKQLELIVNNMENNEITLDTAVNTYQEGISLINFCQTKLQEAKQRIHILDPENNSLKEFTINEV
jgi:exodeoxyribonuclease VII small subunit